MAKRPRILFTTPQLRHPPVTGPYLRIETTIKALSRIADLYIYSRDQIDDLPGQGFYKSFCRKFYFAPSACDAVYDVHSASYEEDLRGLLDLAQATKPDLIWLGYGNISYPLLRYIKTHSNYKVVLDTDSVWSRFVLRKLPYAAHGERAQIEEEGRRKEEEEKWGTAIADVTTAVSKVDVDYYRTLTTRPEQVHLFSNVVDTDAYQPVPPAADLTNPCMYLAGTFWPGSPMEHAARWVIEKVLPRVRRQVRDVHFYIVGVDSDVTLADVTDPGITITGRLQSVLPYLCHADVALVPLRFESGTRFKILEAAACGIPVVSTTLGAEGIPITNEKDILIADDPESFAQSIVRLITDRALARKLAGELRTIVFERFSVPSLVQEGRNILEYLASQPQSTSLTSAADYHSLSRSPGYRRRLARLQARSKNTLRGLWHQLRFAW